MTSVQTMSNSLIPSGHEFNDYQILARNAASSQFYKSLGGEPQIFMIMLAARELGVGPVMALNGGIHCIQGKIELSARLMSSLVRQRGHSMNVEVLNEKECIIKGKRIDNGDEFTASFSMDEANKAGLVRSGSNWTKYPKDMLYARAMSRLARQLFSDVIGTAYVEGEIRETKFEIVNAVKELEIQEDPLENEKILAEFLQNFDAKEHEMMRSYIQKYSEYYKKKLTQSMADFLDRDKFLADYTKWRDKEISKTASAV